MLSYRTPGVTFERPLSRPAIRRLRTDVAGFVGYARSGPLHHPVKVESWPEFTAVFGGHTVQGFLAYAVEGFFANGGRTCWIVRVADPAEARFAQLDLVNGLDDSLVGRLTATSPGRWAHGLALTAIGTSPSRLTLIIRRADDGSAGQESWPELELVDQDSERYVTRVLNDPNTGSRLVRVCPVVGAPLAARLPVIEGRIQVRRPAGGADGLTTVTPEHFIESGPRRDPFDPCAGLLDGEQTWGLRALERIDEVSLVAIPDAIPKPRVDLERPEPPATDCSIVPCPDDPPVVEPFEPEPPELPTKFTPAQTDRLQRALIAHCELLRDRVAILDVPPNDDHGSRRPDEAVAWKQNGGFTSRWAAAYYPWLAVPDPLLQSVQRAQTNATGSLLTFVPPSGHVTGVIARSDQQVGVHKPPANERLAGVEDLAYPLDDVRHGDLNSAGINALRFYLGRGLRVSGARTLDREPAQRYLNVRRLLIFIAESIDEQTQWTVFEPNDRRLWQQVDRVVRAFLLGLWRDGMLDGAKAEDAFHVVCDETSTPPEEIEAGRVICQIGVQPPWPAEFVIARIGIGEGGVELIDTAPGTSIGGGNG